MKTREKSKVLKLYVWVGVFKSYTGGYAFALARSVEHARTLIIRHETSGWPGLKSRDLKTRAMARFTRADRARNVARELKREPRVYRRPVAYVVHGGD